MKKCEVCNDGKGIESNCGECDRKFVMVPVQPVLCPYCARVAGLVSGKDVYPHRPDLFSKSFYLCRPCHAYVGCHPGTLMPLGRLADSRLRTLKMRAHAAFDPIWKSGRMRRIEAYQWLADRMGLPKGETHIGMFSPGQCERVVQVCKEAAP